MRDVFSLGDLHREAYLAEDEEYEVHESSAVYRLNEVQFSRPKGMYDTTWNIFTTNPGGPGFSIVIGRAVIDGSLTLADIGNQVKAEVVANMNPIFTRPLFSCEVGGIPALRMQYNCIQNDTRVHNDHVVFPVSDEQNNILLMQFIASSAYPEGMQEAERNAFEHVLRSIEPRFASP